jgi:hypothetical protein
VYMKQLVQVRNEDKLNYPRFKFALQLLREYVEILKGSKIENYRNLGNSIKFIKML